MLTIAGPAKINLTLEVLGQRKDGFHEVCSLIQIINLSDSLRFQPRRSILIKSDVPAWLPQKSLVSQALIRLRETTGCSAGANIEIRKRIPLVAGLGGDSSDAATTLRGLNLLWDLYRAH